MSIALVMMTVSSILLANMLGILPDVNQLRTQRKVAICESLAINCSLLARSSDARGIASTIDMVAERNSDILSIALRRRGGEVVYKIGEHEKHWRPVASAMPAPGSQLLEQDQDASQDLSNSDANMRSTRENIMVPILHHNDVWGAVEVAFEANSGVGWSAFWTNYPVVTLVGFCALLNACGIYWYLRRTLTYLDPSQAVPERVRTALDTLAEGLVVLDNEQRIVLANRSFAKKVGRAPDELQGLNLDHFHWRRQAEESEQRPWTRTAETRESSIGAKVGLTTGEEGERVFLVNAAPINNEKGEQRGVLASFDDITALESNKAELQRMLEELRESREQIRRRNHELQLLATRDPLTGCMNRRSFFEWFDKLWGLSQRHALPLSCVMLDIDHFKAINDTYGHSTGDEVLRKVAQAMQDTCRDEDILCRYGGEEFCLLTPQLTIAQCELAAERFRTVVKELVFSGCDLRVTVSLGVSSTELGGGDPQAVLDQADKALYVAKRKGRNQVRRWDQVTEGDLQTEQKTATQDAEPSVGEPLIPYPAVASLLTALSFRDPNTALHSTRVAELSVAVARGLMSVKDTYVLEIAALLHDIGKIGVPDRILMKPGPLTAEEWQVMKVHDQIGVDIVESSFANERLAEIVRFHHATYAGNPAQPDLPVGDDIPMGARIVSIADAYDAMVSDRVYRQGRSSEEAFSELRRCAGTQFDPKLVERFIAIVEDHCSRERLEIDSRQTALQLGLQMEQLAGAMDRMDIASIQNLASRLESTAAKNRAPKVQALASELREVASSDPDLYKLVTMTRELLDLCRLAQRAHVESTPEALQADVMRRLAPADLAS